MANASDTPTFTMDPGNSTNSTDPCALQDIPFYSLGLQVAGVFVILVASVLGTGLPLFFKHVPKLSPGPFIFVIGKHIGTGVLIALGLIHLLGPAFAELGNPCLPPIWQRYTFAPLFAMIASLAMSNLEVLAGLLVKHDSKETDPAHMESGLSVHSHGHSHGALLGANVEKTIAAYILEFGLTSHSVIVGIAVGVSSFAELRVLLPALVFHQFFEGFALGARLADVGFSGWNEIVLSTIYSTSAPIGIAIGIGIYTTYDPNSYAASVVSGSFDSVSAGIILYVAYSQMLAVDLPHDLRHAQGWVRRFVIIAAVWFGASVMAVIGAWL
jgi:zinc transporter 1/2/3